MSESKETPLGTNEVSFLGTRLEAETISRTNSHDQHRNGRPLRVVEATYKMLKPATMGALIDLFEQGAAGSLATAIDTFEARAISWNATSDGLRVTFMEDARSKLYPASVVKNWVVVETGDESLPHSLSDIDIEVLGILLKLSRAYSIGLPGIVSKLETEVRGPEACVEESLRRLLHYELVERRKTHVADLDGWGLYTGNVGAT